MNDKTFMYIAYSMGSKQCNNSINTKWTNNQIRNGYVDRITHAGRSPVTSSYFLSASSAMNLASFNWFSKASIRSSSARPFDSRILRALHQSKQKKPTTLFTEHFLQFKYISCPRTESAYVKYIHRYVRSQFSASHMIHFYISQCEQFNKKSSLYILMAHFGIKMSSHCNWHRNQSTNKQLNGTERSQK